MSIFLPGNLGNIKFNNLKGSNLLLVENLSNLQIFLVVTRSHWIP